MYQATIVTGVVCFAVGIFVGRKYEQRAVAAVLAKFAQLDDQAHSLVNRCYTFLSAGLKSELKKLGI